MNEQPEQLRVLRIEPENYPKTVEIPGGLESLQAAVGGDIEAVYPFEDNVALIVNETGKLDGLPLNRALCDDNGRMYDVVAGPMLVMGIGEENFCSLTDEQLDKYEKQFHQPEAFLRVGRKLLVIPIPDESLPANKPGHDPTGRAEKPLNSEVR